MSRSVTSRGSIQSTVVTVRPMDNEIYSGVQITFDEGSASTGTVVVSVLVPGSDDDKVASDSTYTVGNNNGLTINNAALTGIVLTPDSVDAAMTYNVTFFGRHSAQ